MSFISFLKEEGILTAKEAQIVGDSANLKKQCTFTYLLNEGRYDFVTLCKWLSAWSQEAKFSLRIIDDTAGWICNRDFYTKAGGVNESIVKLVLPLFNEHTGEHVALLSQPSDEQLLANIKKWYAQTPYSIGVCETSIWESIYSKDIDPMLTSTMAARLSESLGDTKAIKVDVDSPAKIFCRRIINAGLEKRASDIHFKVGPDACEVSFRIDNINRYYTSIPKKILHFICMLMIYDSKVSVKGPHDTIDGKVAYSPSNYKKPNDVIDLRISLIPIKDMYGNFDEAGTLYDLNIRYLTDKLYTFEEIGMTTSLVETYKYILNMPSGLVIQTGPTGSGKTTTLYSGYAYMRSMHKNILTIEDPVEITMPGITQIDVDSSESALKGGIARLTFDSALKASLRHDPDVIGVGELRDSVTANLAVRAADTGHLVFTSLHTKDAIGAIGRMFNLGIDPYALGESLTAIMGQRLIRRLCPFCKQPYKLLSNSKKAEFFKLPKIDPAGNPVPFYIFHNSKGCMHCDNTGYKGRIAINEILILTPRLRDMVQKHEPRSVFEEELIKMKFRTLYQDGIAKAIDGVISLDDMKPLASDTLAFKGYIYE